MTDTNERDDREKSDHGRNEHGRDHRGRNGHERDHHDHARDHHERKRKSAASFGAAVDAYLESAVHSEGGDLETLAAWCESTRSVLDVACGAGHTAGVVARNDGPEVVAADAAPAMVRTTVEAFDVPGVVADAERLPFIDDAFDGVTCRIAAHHFPNPNAFLEEVARVLQPGGTFAFEDNVAPEDDELAAFLDRLERLRDPTHVESYTTAQWDAWLSAVGFEVEETVRVKTTIEFDPWVETQSLSSGERTAVEQHLYEATPEARSLFEIRIEDGSIRSFANLKALIRARRTE